MKKMMKTIALAMGIAVMLPFAAGCANQQKSEGQEAIWEDGTVLHLTEQTDEPGMHGLSQTGSGMFYAVSRESNSLTDYFGFPENVPAFKYFDAESGQSMYLCARPNCLHDGDEFCPATTENYEILSDPVFLDGYVYAVAHDCTAQLSQSSRKHTNVLLRYAADGTEITKVAELHSIPQEQLDIRYEANALLIAHRGQLWMKCAYTINRNTSDTAMNVASETPFGGYGMFVYAPADGTLTKICGTDEPVQGLEAWDKRGIENMIGLGDAVYFRKSTNWGDPLKGNGIFRIDCLTGKTAELIKQKAGMDIYHFSGFGGKLVYFEAPTSSSYADEGKRFQIYDLATGEETQLTDVPTLAKAFYQDDAETLENFLYNCSNTDGVVSLLCDEAHVFLVLHAFWTWDDGAATPSLLAVCAPDGKIEQITDITELPNVTENALVDQYVNKLQEHFDNMTQKEEDRIRKEGFPEHFSTFYRSYYKPLHYTDGVLYLHGSSVEFTLTLDSILNGDAEIKPLFLHTTN